MVKLLAFDIDGTLLHGEETRLAPAVLNEIIRLKAKGCRICLASGRQFGNLHRLFQHIAPELYYIAENGAVIFGPGTPPPLLDKTLMDQDAARKIAYEIMAVSDCELMLSGENMSYLCPKTPLVVEHVRNFVGNDVTVLPCVEDMPEPIIKVSAFCPSGTAELAEKLKPWGTRCNMAVAGDAWVDFTVSDKGTGVKKLCELLHIDLGDVMAFGDNYNDLPMLEIVGQPYIMDNAVEDLRRRFPNHCDRVTDVLSRL